MIDPAEAAIREQNAGWLGSNPYYLMLILGPLRAVVRTTVQIDLDQPGWTKLNRAFLREQGQWYLVRKSDQVIVATMMVYPGEQPYYVARHVGYASTSGEPDAPKAETINYGIGKKRLDGHVDRIWILSNGCVTLGDDGEDIALDLLKSGML